MKNVALDHRSISVQLYRYLQEDLGPQAQLARQFKISRQALHKHFLKLKKNGAFQPDSDAILPEVVLHQLKTRSLGQRIIYFSSTGSTQITAKQQAVEKNSHGLLVLAARQTAGRGRFERVWASSAGGIWASLVLHPPISPHQASQIPLVLALSIAQTLQKMAKAEWRVKWPNDVGVVEGNKFRKVGGILTEMTAEADQVQWLVAGFGVNVRNVLPKNLIAQAATLAELTEKLPSRAKILATILRNFEKHYEALLNHGFAALKKQWLDLSLFQVGDALTLTQAGEQQSGIFRGLSDDGALKLEAPDHLTRLHYSGETTLKT